jgi:type I restriction enzyme S subunit
LKAVFEKGDVLFGKLRAYLRKYWRADRSGVCSTEFWVLAPAEDMTTSSYLYQVVQTDHFIEVASQGYGTHMPRSDWSSVSEIELPVPALDEQEEIGRVLGEMDAEIEALHTRLDKARQIKQGMMQELLTGRVRLV